MILASSFICENVISLRNTLHHINTHPRTLTHTSEPPIVRVCCIYCSCLLSYFTCIYSHWCIQTCLRAFAANLNAECGAAAHCSRHVRCSLFVPPRPSARRLLRCSMPSACSFPRNAIRCYRAKTMVRVLPECFFSAQTHKFDSQIWLTNLETLDFWQIWYKYGLDNRYQWTYTAQLVDWERLSQRSRVRSALIRHWSVTHESNMMINHWSVTQDSELQLSHWSVTREVNFEHWVRLSSRPSREFCTSSFVLANLHKHKSLTG